MYTNSFFFFVLFVCPLARLCVLQEATRRLCLAPEEGGPWPGLPDTGGKAKHFALLLKQTHVCACMKTHTHMCTDTYRYRHHSTSWLPSVNRCFLPCKPNPQRFTNKCSVSLAPLQVDPGAGWRGSSTPWLSCGVFVNVGSCSSLLAHSPQPKQTNRY